MAEKTWEPIKQAFCQRVEEDVTLEAEMVYPSEHLPDQLPRILAHRCSRAMDCNQDSRVGCTWAGTNPGYDPFAG